MSPDLPPVATAKAAKATAYIEFANTARMLPDCEHNAAWWQQGPGRPPPPDCEHNRPWRAALADAWHAYLEALDALDAVTGGPA